jgi:D-alanyl-D-alanine carboxypeptidase
VIDFISRLTSSIMCDMPRNSHRARGFAFVALLLATTAPPPPSHAMPPFQETARKTVGSDQGVYAEAEDGKVLAAINDSTPVHPASVTKIATTLALLDKLGPTHRFETRLVADGPIEDGTLHGDLLVESQGDPFFVFESAFLALSELREQGLRAVDGVLRVEGPFLFNWQPDEHGARLAATLAGHDGASAWKSIQQQRADLSGVALADAGIRFMLRKVEATKPRTLFVYESPPLASIMKALNSYSNNVFHLLSAQIGGPQAVERIARERVDPELRAQIVIDNAAGAGTTNRMSPRAAVALVRALDAEAKENALSLADLLPVAGIDHGTLDERLRGSSARGVLVAKTGTYGSLKVSALAGEIRTKRYGLVTFAILDKGLDVVAARARQDAFVRALIAEAGGVPIGYDGVPPTPLVEARIRKPQ